MKTVITLTIEHSKPLPDITDVICQRVWPYGGGCITDMTAAIQEVENIYDRALRNVLGVVQRFLPPDSPLTQKDALCEIISIVDPGPWPDDLRVGNETLSKERMREAIKAGEGAAMNFTQKVLSLMEEGKSYTSEELQQMTGADARLIGNALRNIKKWSYVEIIPARQQAYSINDTGRNRIAELPPEVRAKKERERLKTANRRARLKAEAGAPLIKPQAPKVDLVSTAMKSRPALDMAWMSVAREQEASHV